MIRLHQFNPPIQKKRILYQKNQLKLKISAPEFKMPVVKKTDTISDISDKKSAASAGSEDLRFKIRCLR